MYIIPRNQYELAARALFDDALKPMDIVQFGQTWVQCNLTKLQLDTLAVVGVYATEF